VSLHSLLWTRIIYLHLNQLRKEPQQQLRSPQRCLHQTRLKLLGTFIARNRLQFYHHHLHQRGRCTRATNTTCSLRVDGSSRLGSTRWGFYRPGCHSPSAVVAFFPPGRSLRRGPSSHLGPSCRPTLVLVAHGCPRFACFEAHGPLGLGDWSRSASEHLGL
jgi:hypothetical protein